MIGKFSGVDVPACGFSIGFERIITILTDHLNELKTEQGRKQAFLVEKGADGEKLTEVFRKAQELRAEGITVTVQTRRKNAKMQKEKLAEEGYTEITEVFNR